MNTFDPPPPPDDFWRPAPATVRLGVRVRFKCGGPEMLTIGYFANDKVDCLYWSEPKGKFMERGFWPNQLLINILD